MDLSKLTEVYIPHLRTQFGKANVILFTGAGFSLGAKNIAGGTPPTGRQLARIYWSICYGSDPFDEDASLSDLYDDCLSKNPKELTDQSVKQLTIAPGSLVDWYRTYFELPWLAAYTLNLDNLAQVASAQFKLSRAWTKISATNHFSSDLKLAGPNQIDLVHLNGTLEDLPDRVTFSTRQYAQRASETDPWSLRIANDLLSHSVVFIGTDLNEPPLWSFIEMRGGRGARGMGELRPRSYLVSPNLSRPRAALLAQFNVVHIPMTSEQFAKEVLTHIDRNDRAAGFDMLRSINAVGRSASEPIELNKIDISPRTKTDYLLGQDPGWGDITSGTAIERDFDTDIEAAARQQLTDENRLPILITGPAGTGKTTSLMRIALKLHAEGVRVAWIDRHIEIAPHRIVDFVAQNNDLGVLAIDDADAYGPILSTLIREILEFKSPPLILIEMRSHYIDRSLVASQLGKLRPIEMTLPSLSDRDIAKLIDSLDRENRLGTLKGLNRAMQLDVFRQKANRELVVAMYEATTNMSFRERIVNELDQLDDTARYIYAMVAICASRRFTLSKDEIVHGTGQPTNETVNEINRLLKRRLLVHPRVDDSTYTCRHRVIGDFVKDAIHQQGMMYPIILGILRLAALRTNSQMSGSAKPKRMLRAFINHEFVYEMLDLEGARRLYAELEPLLNGTHHFWLHRGAIEVEYGSLDHAENFLAQALSLSNDALVRNEWAYLLFKKAIRIPGSLAAAALVEEAQNLLVELIFEEKSHPHPYHVLGNQGLAWSRVGIRDNAQRASYLRWIEKHLERGMQEFPMNSHIREIRQRLQQDYLSLAVE